MILATLIVLANLINLFIAICAVKKANEAQEIAEGCERALELIQHVMADRAVEEKEEIKDLLSEEERLRFMKHGEKVGKALSITEDTKENIYKILEGFSEALKESDKKKL